MLYTKILLLGFCMAILNCIVESLETTTQYFALQESTNIASDYITVKSPSDLVCGIYCSKYMCKAASFDRVKKECRIYVSPISEMETVYAEHAVLMEIDKRWHLFNGRYYYIGLTPMTWTEAQNDCRKKKSNLVKIDDDAEQQWITSLIQIYKDDILNEWWIGGNNLGSEGNWVWVSDNTSLLFDSWNPGQPDNYGNNEHCAEIRRNFNLRWNDKNCNDKIQYICEK